MTPPSKIFSLPTELESPLAFVEDGILTSEQPSPLITTVVAGSDSCALSQEKPPLHAANGGLDLPYAHPVRTQSISEVCRIRCCG